MTTLPVKGDAPWTSLVALSLLCAVVGASGVLAVRSSLGGGSLDNSILAGEPQTVEIAPREFSYRAAGDYYKNGYAVDGPMRAVSMRRPLTIMKYQVSNADYARCVAAGSCTPADAQSDHARPDLPATGVSFEDAQAYATWLSRATGEIWTLPTDEQLAFAAGMRFPDDALGADVTNSSNPADRWLANYRREAESSASRDPVPKPLGTFGENEFGIADFGGNVWEWTTTCSRRIDLETSNGTAGDAAPCGIYHAIGKHRAPMIFFVRNPKGGGCAVGTPPDNLGFRLVKDTRWYARLARVFGQSGFQL
jgi:formylglycine-generating enzyme required for sulfatase activity